MDATLIVDTSPFSQIDRRFFYVLFASMFLHAVAATWLARQPHVVVEETTEDRPFARATLPPLLAIPKSFPAVKLAPPAGGPKKTPGPGRPQNGGPRPSALSGLLAGAIDELKGKSDVDAALDGARAGHVDTTTLAVRRERGPQEAQAIGPITTSSPGRDAIGIGEHVDAPPSRPPTIDDVILDDVPDPTAFMRFINARKTALATCYEQELKRNRSLKGRITVQLTVAADGRARDVDVDPGSLGSRAVAECIRALVRRWTFPVRPGEELPLQFPVLFSPAQ